MLPTPYPVSPIRAIAIILAHGTVRSMRIQATESIATFEEASTVIPQKFLEPLPPITGQASGICTTLITDLQPKTRIIRNTTGASAMHASVFISAAKAPTPPNVGMAF